MWVLGEQSLSAGKISHTCWMPAGVFYTQIHTQVYIQWRHICLSFSRGHRMNLSLDNTCHQHIFKNPTVSLANTAKGHSQMTTYSWTEKETQTWNKKYVAQRRQEKISRTVTVNHSLKLDILHHITLEDHCISKCVSVGPDQSGLQSCPISADSSITLYLVNSSAAV